MGLHRLIEEALNYPGATSRQAEQHASALAAAIERVVEIVRPWAPLRTGHCVYCGEPVDPFDGVELRLVWVTARLTRDGRKQGGRNNPGRPEGTLGLWMHRGCSDNHQNGIHRDQRVLIVPDQ